MRPERTVKKAVDRKEIWKPIEKYNGLYEASNKGRIRRSGKPIKVRKNPQNIKQRVIKKAIKKLFLNNNGYLRVNISTDSYDRHVLVHRLIAETFIPNPLNKRTVNHKDLNKTNNNIRNLEWLTYSENNIHSWRIKKLRIKNEQK